MNQKIKTGPELVLATKRYAKDSTFKSWWHVLSTAFLLLLALALLAATAIGILQARRMTTLRTAFISDPATETTRAIVRRNASLSAIIRTLLVAGYIALLGLAVLLVVTI